MPILCFGGSFNPIHHGHLGIARAVVARRGFDQVRLIVSADPPHKPRQSGRHHDLAPANDRLTMCRLAVEGDQLFVVDDLELHRAGPSYTLDTVRELRRRDGLSAADPLHWLIGADSLHQLPTWYEARTLLDEVEFVVVARPGWTFDFSTLPETFHRLRKNVVETPIYDISASDIRRRISGGEPVDHLIPKAVAEYIRAHSLYQSVGSP